MLSQCAPPRLAADPAVGAGERRALCLEESRNFQLWLEKRSVRRDTASKETENPMKV